MKSRTNKKTLKRLISAIMAVSLLLVLIPQATFAESVSLLKIEGSIESGLAGVEVSLEVFREGKNFEDIVVGENMGNVILHHDQTTTTDGGAYSFEFEVFGSGSCAAYVCSADGEMTVHNLSYDPTVEVNASISSDELGHIYFEKESQDFVLKLTNNNDSRHTLTVKNTVVCDGKAGETTKTDVTLDGFEEKTTNISVSAGKYGFFTLKTEIYLKDGNFVMALAPLRFSVVNTPQEGMRNENLGVNISLRNWHTGDSDDMVFEERDPVKNLKLAEKVGFGFIRTEADLQDYNSNRTATETGLKKEWQRDFYELLEDYGMTATVILARNDTDGPQRADYNDTFNPFAASITTDPLLRGVTNEFTTLNEPDLSKLYTVDQYVPFEKSLYDTIDNAAPDAFVWGPVTAGVIDRAWLTEFLKQGGGDYIVGLDIHGYTLKESPEAGELVKHIQAIKQLMAKYGISNKPIYRSEYGWTSVGEDGYTDAYQQGYYNVRMLFLHDAYDLCDKAACYRMNDTGLNNEQETRFGMVKYKGSEIPYEAKPLYLTYGNYNALMIGAEFKERVELSSDVALYRYVLADGKDCAVTWSISGKADSTIKLKNGGSSLTEIQLVDSYGNAETIYSKDGDFMLGLTEEPMYLIGDFDSIASGTNKITTDKNEELMAAGSRVAVTLTKNFGDNAEIALDLPDNLTVVENNGFSGNTARIVFQAKTSKEELEKAIIYIRQAKQYTNQS